jgi:acyl dehydratase
MARRESKSLAGMGIITEFVELVNQDGKVTQQGEHTTMIRKRPV